MEADTSTVETPTTPAPRYRKKKTRHSMTREIYERIREYAELEWPSAKIARKIGNISAATVARWRKLPQREALQALRYYQRHTENRPKGVSPLQVWDPRYEATRKASRQRPKRTVPTPTAPAPSPLNGRVDGLVLAEYRLSVVCPLCQGSGHVNAKLDLTSETHDVQVETRAHVTD